MCKYLCVREREREGQECVRERERGEREREREREFACVRTFVSVCARSYAPTLFIMKAFLRLGKKSIATAISVFLVS